MLTGGSTGVAVGVRVGGCVSGCRGESVGLIVGVRVGTSDGRGVGGGRGGGVGSSALDASEMMPFGENTSEVSTRLMPTPRCSVCNSAKTCSRRSRADPCDMLRRAAPYRPWGRGSGTHIPVARGLRVPVQSGAIRVERGAREVVIGSGNLVRVDLECAIHSLVKHKRSAVRSDRDNATVARQRRNRKADEPVRPN